MEAAPTYNNKRQVVQAVRLSGVQAEVDVAGDSWMGF